MAELTTVERTSDRELVATRHFDAPVQRVFEAWTTPALVMTWWAPASFGITFVSCEMDVRTGGSYRFVFSHPAADAPKDNWGLVILATIVAAITSFIAVKWLLRYVQSHTFNAFGWYRIILAVVIFALLLR